MVGRTLTVDLYCVGASDIVLVQHYLQGITTFTSSQKVAADVNIDGVIDIMDAIEITVTVLGIQNDFDNSITIDGVVHNDVSAVYPTESSLNQLDNATFNVPYSCVYEYNPFPSNILIGQNFKAIRLGGVNQTCDYFFTMLAPVDNLYICDAVGLRGKEINSVMTPK